MSLFYFQLQRLTFWTRHSTLHREDIDAGSEIECDATIEELDPKANETLGFEETKGEVQDFNAESHNSRALALWRSTVDVVVVVNGDPWWRNVINWFCGIEKQDHKEATFSEEERKAKDAAMMSIEEKKTWSVLCNVNAVILMTVAVFLCAFFG
jgi:hypothetical protein